VRKRLTIFSGLSTPPESARQSMIGLRKKLLKRKLWRRKKTKE